MNFKSFFYIPENEVADMTLILGDDFLKYRNFAIEAHGNQMRKYQNAPYVSHLDQIANMLYFYWNFNQNQNYDFGLCLRVAYLHDVIEDTDVEMYDIQHFIDHNDYKLGVDSQRVKSLLVDVQSLTDPKEGFQNRYDRLRQYNENLFYASKEAQIVKCFDIMSNAGSIVDHAPGFAKQYLQEKMECLGCLNKLPKDLKDDCFNLLMSQFMKL